MEAQSLYSATKICTTVACSVKATEALHHYLGKGGSYSNWLIGESFNESHHWSLSIVW